MKAIKVLGLLTILSCMLPRIATAQDVEKTSKSDSTGLPGDNFSLEGALELFKNSSSLEDFEKRLNQKSNNVNNLDLNSDGKVDYVKVTDKVSNNVHAIILRVNVNAKESQDVAVIAVEKDGDKSAIAQIIGNKDLYGDDVVVEPIGNDEVKSGSGGKGPAMTATKSVFVVVNVWYWPCVQYIYMPNYVVWSSPWYWGYYPPWWSPWSPYPWYYHHSHCAYYGTYHHVVHVHRVNHGPVYRPYVQSSPTVQNHFRTARQVSPVEEKTVPARQTEAVQKDKMIVRPVEGTQGEKINRQTREVAPMRQNPERNVEPVPRQSNPQSNQRVNTPQRSNPQVTPQRQPQVSPPRTNPQRTMPPVRVAPSGGIRRFM